MSIRSLINEVLEIVAPERKSFWQKNKWYIISGSLLVLGLAGYYGYRVYSLQKNTEGFSALGRYVERYVKNTNVASDVARLDDGALALEAQSVAGSDAAAYFSAYAAQELINQGKGAEAVTILKKAVGEMTPSSPLTALYTVKLALLQIDSDDQSIKNDGLVLLKKVADDVMSPAWDVAVYYLGRLAWVQGDVEGAKKVWNPALEKIAQARAGGETNRYSESPWLSRAKMLLDTIA